jgi:hypothetical protein
VKFEAPTSTGHPHSIRPYVIAWFAMLLVSIANGALRDFTYGPRVGELAGHQISTATSVLLLGLVIAFFIRRHPPASARHALGIGLAWMVCTIAFEFLFFHFAGGHAWSELLANYDVSRGRVWVVVLAWIAVAPLILRRRGPPAAPSD